MQTFGLADIDDCARRLAPHVLPTPLMPWPRSDEATVYLKLEMLQHGGSFKTRGAVNNLLNLETEDLARGVTAVSAGNHAIAVAYAARALGSHAKVVMQNNANPARIAAARRLGAEVVLENPGEPAFAAARRIADEEGRAFIHPFEGLGVSMGTATLGRELLTQAPSLDAVIVAVGGGGLISGVARAVKLLDPSCRVIGVEPTTAATMSASFRAGRTLSFDPSPTIADSLSPPMTMPYSFELARQHVDELVQVDDDAMCVALSELFEAGKFALEPACCAGLAAVNGPLRGRLTGKAVAVILCGSNIDSTSFHRYLERGERVREVSR